MDCIFCKISQGKIPVKRIYENGNFFSFPDANPVTNGHSLVVSRKHFKTTLDLPSSIGSELVDCIKGTALKIMDAEKAEGFNVISNNFPSAGQVVPHVHYHIIPRKDNDGFKMIS